MTFTVPGKPVSINRAYHCAYKKGRSGFYKSHEAKQYAEWVALIARRAMDRRAPLTGSVELHLGMFFPTQRQDIDSALKGLLDALQGIVYANDSQVRRLVVHKDSDKDCPRVEIAATEITP